MKKEGENDTNNTDGNRNLKAKKAKATKIAGIFREARTLLRRPSGRIVKPTTDAVQYAVSKWKPRKGSSKLAFIELYAFVAFVLLLNALSIGVLFLAGPNLGVLAYWAYVFLDRNASRTSGRPKQWFRNWRFWKRIGEYFPMVIHPHPEKLDTNKTYIFGYHPHGVISLGALVCFGTNGVGFAEKLPGIDLRLLTLRLNFFVPVLREVLLWLGICDVSKQSILHHLARGQGSAVMIVIGGASESLHAQNGGCTLSLRNRKGFVKMALRSGSSLVPVFSFGETELFDLADSNGITARFQQAMKKTFGFTLPMFYGRGIWLTRGLLPYQRPVHIVMGKPVDCPKIDNPTQEDVDKYHDLYCKGLIDVFNANKKAVGMNRTQEIIIS